jgi:hypothetical protein
VLSGKARGQRRPYRSRCLSRGGKDRQEFFGFLAQRFNSLWRDDFGIGEDFEPEDTFVRFFQDDSEFRNELGVRSRTLRRSAVGRD